MSRLYANTATAGEIAKRFSVDASETIVPGQTVEGCPSVAGRNVVTDAPYRDRVR